MVKLNADEHLKFENLEQVGFYSLSKLTEASSLETFTSMH